MHRYLNCSSSNDGMGLPGAEAGGARGSKMPRGFEELGGPELSGRAESARAGGGEGKADVEVDDEECFRLSELEEPRFLRV